MSLRAWICGLLGCGSEERSTRLLQHFVTQLKDDLLYSQHPTVEPAIANQAIADEIRRLLEIMPPTWEIAYEAERLLVYIKPARRLGIEVERRVTEAEIAGLPSAGRYRAELTTGTAALAAAVAATVAASSNAASAAGAANERQLQAMALQTEQRATEVRTNVDGERRAILAAVLDDLQWNYQKRNLVRQAISNSAINLVWFGIWTMVVCALPFLAFLIERQFKITFFSKFIAGFPNYGLYTVVSFGLLGAFFSRLISLNASREFTVEAAESLFSWRSLIIRGAVGMCGAVIVYFLLKTGVLGLIAPDLSKLSFSKETVETVLGSGEVLLPSKDWALLIIWSFLAGFSEKLVPDSLSRAEAQVTGKK